MVQKVYQKLSQPDAPRKAQLPNMCDLDHDGGLSDEAKSGI